MRVINMTPHPITVAGLTIAPDGRVPRLREETRTVGHVEVDGHTLPVTETTFGALDGLPEPADGVVYVVSRMVAEAAPHRHDLFFPGQLLRDSEGRVIGAASLARLPVETVVVSTRMEQGDIESVRVTLPPAVADALRSLGEREGLSIWVETPAQRAERAARWRKRLAELPADAPERRELERLAARDEALSSD